MKKGVSWIWRLVAVAVLLCALLPVAFSAGAEAATPPSTYLNPLPQYLNASTYALLINTGIDGTARAATGLSVQTVAIQISYTNGSYTYYWNGSAFTGTQIYINTTAVASPWTPQYDFNKSDQLPPASALFNNYTYTITALAVDSNYIIDSTGSSRYFIYDNIKPVNGNFTAVGNANISNVSWNASNLDSISGIISGVCSDTAPGKVAKVQVAIWKDSNDNGSYDSGEYSWDGAAWVSNGATPATVTASGTTTWTLSTASVVWTNNTNYGVEARAIDSAGNAADWVPHSFYYVRYLTPSTVPVISLDTFPAYFNTLPFYFNSANLQAITGSVNASINKSINVTAITIFDPLLGWWNGAAFNTTTATWLSANAVNGAFNNTGQIDWSLNTSAAGLWETGHTYQITVKSIQNASWDGGAGSWNLSHAQSTTTSAQTIICDNVAPVTATIVIPSMQSTSVGDVVFDSLSSISGTCADTIDGSAAGQVKAVMVSISDENLGLTVWSGTTWVNGLALGLPFASGTGSWVLDTTAVPWEHMHTYMVQAVGVDSAGNTIAPTTSAEFTFVRDLTNTVTPAPTSTPTITTTINNISDYVTSLTSINGTANSSSTVTGVLVQINRSSDNYCWNGSSWLNSSTWLAATATDGAFGGTAENWTINASTSPAVPAFANDSTYYVYAKAYSGSTNGTAVSEHFTIGVAPTPTPTSTPTPTPTPIPTATPTPTPTPSTTASGTIGASGGTLTTSDNKVIITFPAGAFSANTEVTITKTSPCDASDATFTVGDECFTVTAASALASDATICVTYSQNDLTAAVSDTSRITLGYYSGGTWHEASSITRSNGQVCGTTSHLSDWAVLIKAKSSTWAWYYWVLIGIGAFIVILAIVLLVVLPKRRDQSDVPPDSLIEEEF